MKKTKLFNTKYLALYILCFVLISSCKKDNPSPPTHTEPNLSSLFMRFLRHNATDSIATLPHGISVHLYFSPSDQMNHTNQIGAPLTPDSFGQISLPAPVQKKTYYWWAEMGANCVENYGSVDASINITHSTYAELTSPDTLFILNNDTCTTCHTYNIYMKPASDYLASRYIFVGDMKWVKADTAHPAHYHSDTIPNLPIGVDSVRITRDTTLRTGVAGLTADSGNTVDALINEGLMFTTQMPFTLHTVDIIGAKKKAGTFNVNLQLQDSVGNALLTKLVTLSAASGVNTITLDWNIPVHTDMRLVRISGGTADSLKYSPGMLATPDSININGLNFGFITNGIYSGTPNSDYSVAFNWKTSYVLHPAVDTTFAVTVNCGSSTQKTFPH